MICLVGYNKRAFKNGPSWISTVPLFWFWTAAQETIICKAGSALREDGHGTRFSSSFPKVGLEFKRRKVKRYPRTLKKKKLCKFPLALREHHFLHGKSPPISVQLTHSSLYSGIDALLWSLIINLEIDIKTLWKTHQNQSVRRRHSGGRNFIHLSQDSRLPGLGFWVAMKTSSKVNFWIALAFLSFPAVLIDVAPPSMNKKQATSLMLYT